MPQNKHECERNKESKKERYKERKKGRKEEDMEQIYYFLNCGLHIP